MKLVWMGHWNTGWRVGTGERVEAEVARHGRGDGATTVTGSFCPLGTRAEG